MLVVTGSTHATFDGHNPDLTQLAGPPWNVFKEPFAISWNIIIVFCTDRDVLAAAQQTMLKQSDDVKQNIMEMQKL